MTNLPRPIVDPVPSAAREQAVRVCALLTCFNRREKTLACLQALVASAGSSNVQLHAVLVDDGSTDGTAEAVREAYPWIQVVSADGALYWCRGMHRAFDAALCIGFDFYLWLNDDTMLHPQALASLLAAESALRQRQGIAVIMVGSTVDATTGVVTYGGERRASRWMPLRVARVQPSDQAQRCDSMTGNIVLISHEVARLVGNLDPTFEHSMGDTDYALRAGQRGVQVWIDAGVHGTCSDNPSDGTWCDPTLPFARRWRDMMTRKGLPWRSWLTLTRRHAGPLWPLYFASPYVKVVMQSAFATRMQSRRNLP